jgi:hypothetical protein
MALPNPYPRNYAPQPRRSRVAHLPGQQETDKVKSGDDYTFEFEDSLLSYKGHVNIRLDGAELTGMRVNKYSPLGERREYGGHKNPNIEHLVPIYRDWGGDINLDKNPVVQTYTTSIFFGTSLAGYQEDTRYPNVGPDFSYIFITKIFTFNPETDEYFITELLGDEDPVFERTLKQDLSYANKFSLRILDEGVENDLKQEYNIHFNAGMFSLIGTYATCSESPYSMEMQLTTQYVAKDQMYNYYGTRYNRYHDKIPTQGAVSFRYNSGNHEEITGSFTIANNVDTWWWRRPQTNSFFNGPSNAGQNSSSGHTELTKLQFNTDGVDSLYNFFERLMDNPGDFDDPVEAETFGTPPAKKDLHIMTFNEAKGCVKQIQTELKYAKNTLQPLRHFGSISLSPGKLVPLPGVHLGESPSHGSVGINASITSPSFTEFTVQTAYDSALPGLYTHYNWLVGGDGPEGAAEYYAPGTSDPITGSGNLDYSPKLSSFTISKLEKRNNVIMADINKINDLFDGVGGKGFVCIPENLHPTIKSNLDYFLKKAELIESGPDNKMVGEVTTGGGIGRIIRKARLWKGGHLWKKRPGTS